MRNKKIVKKHKATAGAIFLDLIGLILLFVYPPIGTIIGILLLIAASGVSTRYACSNCGNYLDDKDVKICSVCSTVLKSEVINKHPKPSSNWMHP